MASVQVGKRTDRGLVWATLGSELYSQRTIFLTGPIDDSLAEYIIMQLMCLDKEKVAPIRMFINSPGGSVSAGLAIVDCMRGVASEVHTCVIGIAASMGAAILACGQPGYRVATTNAEVLIHQPMMFGMGGQASDIAIAADSILKKRDKLNHLLGNATKQTKAKIEKATERDNWLDAKEALAFGIIDQVIEKLYGDGNKD